MAGERLIEAIFEYPDVPDLGIEGSHSLVWVPRDYFVAKTIQVAWEVIGIAEKVASKIEVIRSGGLDTAGQKGDIYQSPTTASSN